MSQHAIRVVSFGERAFLVEMGTSIDAEVNARVHGLAARLDGGGHGIDGLERCVPAYASLLVRFDPMRADPDRLQQQLAELAADVSANDAIAGGRTVDIPVRYGGDDGPDLADIARRTGMSGDAVIELHASVTYRVYMLGFSPGFAYLGLLPEPLRLPRREDPRVRVPEGSVAIAAAQTAVYPQATAGGWHLLGRTDLRMWDPDAAEPARLRPGDDVRFVVS